MLTVGSLFAGIGGFDLGLERAGMKVVWQVEIDPFRRRILRKHWPGTWQFKDVKEFMDDPKFKALPRSIRCPDLICGGFPCQPFSIAGKQGGTEDIRDLWPDMLRAIRALQPSFV